MSNLQYSEAIPILRSFESEGKRYVYGYAAIFDSPDMLGTIITRQAVEDSLEHLKKFPAVRFMHRIPFGQIIFDGEVDGQKTFIDQHGFHVLCQIYDQYDKEWNMVKQGGWGFSYGFMPDAKGGTGQKCLARNECYTAFVKGVLYEVSIVDAPAHRDAIAHTVQRIQRMLNGNKPHSIKTPQRFGSGFRGMIDEAFGNEEPQKVEPVKRGFGHGFLGMIDQAFKGVERQADKPPVVIAKIPHPAIVDPTYGYPLICSKQCPHTQCSSWGTQEMEGKPCRNRVPTNEEVSIRNMPTLRSFHP